MLNLIKVRNKPVQIQMNNQWITPEPVQFNPNRIELTFDSHLESDSLESTNLFKSGSITGKQLLAIQDKLVQGNPQYKSNLNVVSDDTVYTIQSSTPKGSTKPMRFRHWTITKSNTPVTSVTVAYVPPAIPVSVSL
jgi:hypothetical protein